MIVVVQVGEEVQHRQVLGVETRMVAGTEPVAHRADRELGRRVRRVHDARQFRRRGHAVHDQLVVVQPAHHVEVDHRADLLERHRRMVGPVRGPEQAQLLAAEGREHDRAPRGVPREQPRQLEHRRHPRCIVIGAVPDRVLRLGVEGEVAGPAQVVHVRADHDVLVDERRIAPAQEPHHVDRGQLPGRRVRVPRRDRLGRVRHQKAHGAFARAVRVTPHDGAKPERLEPLRHVRRCRVEAGRAGRSPFALVVGHPGDVAANRRRVGTRGARQPAARTAGSGNEDQREQGETRGRAHGRNSKGNAVVQSRPRTGDGKA